MRNNRTKIYKEVKKTERQWRKKTCECKQSKVVFSTAFALTILRGSLTFKFNISIIQFREKLSKQNMKKTFRENVFICDDISLNREENELRRKYRVFKIQTEKRMHPPILEIEQNGWFHWI